MLNFHRIRSLRDRLLDSLQSWKSSKDGFYRSAPIVGPEYPPSFTNTGIVLQAFNESGQTYLAQELANRLINFLKEREYKPFPHEKVSEGEDRSHVLCNSWPIFAILDCYPSRVTEFNTICEWFLSTQKVDGSWDLLPGEDTKYPIFTAYALSAILQYYDCCKKIELQDESYFDRLLKSLRTGFDYLLLNRSKSVAEKDLLLWPASLNQIEITPLSFSTSAICMHMIAKASSILKRDDLNAKVENTILQIVNSFDSIGECKIGNLEIKIWDQIHVNESSLNYFFAFFSPISLTTFLRYHKSPQFINNEKYYKFMKYLIEWILNNETNVAEKSGIKGGPSMPEIKTWSTAQAAIVLSYILKRGYGIDYLISEYKEIDKKYIRLNDDYTNLERQYDGVKKVKIEQDGFLKEMKNVLESNNSKYAKFVVMVTTNAILAIIGFLLYMSVGDEIQKWWPSIAGKAWFITFLIVIGGWNFVAFKKKLYRIISNLVISSIKLHRLQKIFSGISIDKN